MLQRALIALDHSVVQGPLLDCLSDLRDMGVSSVIMIHVVQIGYGQGAGFGNKDILQDWLASRATSLRDAGLDVEVEIRASGDVAKDIADAAHAHGADLIVIGSRGQNMIRGLFLGSVAREVIRRSPLAVRLEWVEPTDKPGEDACKRTCHAGLRRLLVATDFSPQAQAAELAAIKLAAHAGRVDLLHVTSPQEAARYTRWPVMAHAALSSIAQEIAAAGGKVEVHLAEGKPSEQIAKTAADGDADLIVIGKQGQGWVESRTIGSTATNLCEIARRPVLVVPLQNEKA